MKLLKQIWPRLLLYAVLVSIIAGTVIFWFLSNHSSLSENFLAGSIEIAITVLLIDGLLSMERSRKIKALNTGNAGTIMLQVGFAVVRFLKRFEFTIEPNDLEAVAMTNEALRKKVNEFFESDQYKQHLTDVKNSKKGMLKKLRILKEEMSTAVKSVREGLKDVEPYPDPELVEILNYSQLGINVSVEVVKTMYGVDKIVKDARDTPDGTLLRGVTDQEMERLTTTQKVESGGANLHGAYKSFLNAMLMIHERSEKNNLHYDV